MRTAALAALLTLSILSANASAWIIDSVFARADSCIAISWTATVQNTDPAWYTQWSSKCTGADTIYKHCDFITGNTYRSIAYSYGGEDHHAEFRRKLDGGLRAGSHMCHYNSYGDPTPVIAGTDCSGFLCFTWNEPRQSTGMLIDNTDYEHPVRSALMPGDALVKRGSHCVLVADPTDPAATLIAESTSDGNCVRTRKIDVNSAYWLNYVPVRNPAISATGIIENLTQDIHAMAVVQGSSIRLSINETDVQMELFNLQGQQILSRTVSGSDEIDISGIASGACILRLSSPSFIKTAPITLCR